MARWHIRPKGDGFELVYENRFGGKFCCGRAGPEFALDTVIEWVLIYGATTAIDEIVLPDGQLFPVRPKGRA